MKPVVNPTRGAGALKKRPLWSVHLPLVDPDEVRQLPLERAATAPPISMDLGGSQWLVALAMCLERGQK